MHPQKMPFETPTLDITIFTAQDILTASDKEPGEEKPVYLPFLDM